DSSKKRTVYTFQEDEMCVLKLLAHLLYRYDVRISTSCYSFRRHKTAKTAWDKILEVPGLDTKYVLKADIHDYFNSMDTEILTEILQDVLKDDPKLYGLLERLLKEDRCIYRGEVIHEKRGAMAGTPTASFFANLYLRDLDEIFESMKVPYFRYSDDILIFADSSGKREEYYRILTDIIAQKKLTMNPDKLHRYEPSEPFEFLGFKYAEGKIDLSDVTAEKMKGKIRRKARSIYRWRIRNKKTFEEAAIKMIRSFDNKMYDLTGTNSFTWTRFYFPVLTCDEGMRKIDETMVQYLRYLSSGRHYKGNYRITYEQLKKLGYTPLTAEYYRWKEENRELDRQNKK
ncbi:MAG: hypothetical protein IIZ48_01255, partial [Erysipelotrichales bacterium]|nr:hypothetical protein [Erysipelotrichales bacterium]